MRFKAQAKMSHRAIEKAPPHFTTTSHICGGSMGGGGGEGRWQQLTALGSSVASGTPVTPG